MDDLHPSATHTRSAVPPPRPLQDTSASHLQRRSPEQLSQAEVFEAVSALANSGSTESESKTSTEQSEATVMRVRTVDTLEQEVLLLRNGRNIVCFHWQRTHEERDQIHARYAKLQKTLNSLKEELSDPASDVSSECASNAYMV